MGDQAVRIERGGKIISVTLTDDNLVRFAIGEEVAYASREEAGEVLYLMERLSLPRPSQLPNGTIGWPPTPPRQAASEQKPRDVL